MTIQLSHPCYSAQGTITELSHLAAPIDHGPGRTCIGCGRRVNRYAPLPMCDVCRTQTEEAEATTSGPYVRTGYYTESIKRAQRQSKERRKQREQLVAEYGDTVSPDTPAEVVRALIVVRAGTMQAAAALLGWSDIDIRTTCTPLHRNRASHRLIPQWKCDALTKFFQERR